MQYRQILILFACLCFFSPPGSGQEYDRNISDSLKRQLFRTQDKAKKALILIELARDVAPRAYDSATLLLEKALRENSGTGSLEIIGRIYEMRGDLFNDRGDASHALKSYRNALFCFQKISDKDSQKRLLNIIGNSYSSAGNFSEALKYYLECKDLADLEGDIDMQARLYNNIGKIYAETNDFSSAIENYRKAIRIFTHRRDSIKLAAVQLNLAAAYSETGNQDQAGELLRQAALVQGIIDKKVLLSLSGNIQAHRFFLQKKYQEALEHLFHSLEIVMDTLSDENPVQQKVMMTRILDNIGWAYFLSGNYQAAGQYLLRGYKLAISLGLLSEIVMVSDHLSHLFEKICKPDSAILFFRINKVHSDSLLKAQSINVVRLAEVKMEFDKEVREKQTQLVYNRQLQKRNLAISVAVVVVLIALIIILMMRLKIINQKKRRIEAEKRQAEVEQQATRNLLESQNKELVTKVMHSTRVNELVISIAEKLKRLELHEDSENARIRNELIRELLSSANKDDSWKEFELRFQNVQLDFYERLRSGFPNLTSSEVRLCAFLKLDMNTKEISAVTRQTERAIIVARHRLRQKLGLKNTDNLPLFLSQF